jgi:mannonate dehydratase
VINTVYDNTTLITEQLIDSVRMAIVHGGGLTPMLKIAHFAEIYGVKMGCHGPTDVSPINLAATIHCNLSINNFGVMEFMRHTPEIEAVYPHDYKLEDGYLTIGDKPGLGVDFDESSAKKYPYERAYLPVNRLLDGTMHDW